MSNRFKKAFSAYENKNYELSVSILDPLCMESNPDALSLLGVFYQLGLGVECDGVKAVSLLERAVILGKGEAAHNLGTIYCAGLPGIKANPELGRSYYKKAKSMGAQLANIDFYK